MMYSLLVINTELKKLSASAFACDCVKVLLPCSCYLKRFYSRNSI